jgi:hypothetical protein
MENKINEKSKADIEAEQIQKYWDEVYEKTDSVLQLLKGTTYKQLKSIQRNLNEKIEKIINESVI